MNTSRRGKTRRRIQVPRILLLALTIFIFLEVRPPPAWGQTYKNLAQARQAAASAKTQDVLKAVLLSAILQLSVRDGIALCAEYEPKVSPMFKAELRATIGGLYLLLGQTQDAAAWYGKAAVLDSRYVAQALRLSISVGDQKSAASLLKNEAISAEAKTMFDVWLSLYENDYAAASLKAKDALAHVVSDRQIRRELLFLQYIAEFGQYGTSHSTLMKDFPRSIEADVVRGKAFPSPWFVLSLGLSWLDAPALLSDFQKKSVSDQEDMDSGASYWLQVGYFSSKDNAERLSKTLSAKKFQTRIVESKNEHGDPRWAVHVMAQKEDWQKTRSVLMDLGYESYLVGP